MALDSGSDEGSGTMLGVIVGAILVVAVILFALGTFGSKPVGPLESGPDIEIKTPAPVSPPETPPTAPNQ